MSELSAPESAFLLVLICLSLASLLVWACRDAERQPPASYIRSLLTRRPMRYWWERLRRGSPEY
jgi:hypothetical protein